jgi:hypothetical protein
METGPRRPAVGKSKLGLWVRTIVSGKNGGLTADMRPSCCLGVENEYWAPEISQKCTRCPGRRQLVKCRSWGSTNVQSFKNGGPENKSWGLKTGFVEGKL